METVDEIRRQNLQLLMDHGLGTVTFLASESGISRSTLSSVMNGKQMLNKHAREIERAFDKTFGWLDLPHNSKGAVEYEKVVLSASLKCLYGIREVTELYDNLTIKGKVDLLDKLFLIFTDPAARELKPKTLMIMLGITNERKAKRKQKSAQAKNKSKNRRAESNSKE